jgi:multisubunit Na+/H+ antiporter MnhB subunit
MNKKLTLFTLAVILMNLLVSCRDYLKFELTRYLSGFFISLIIALIVLLIVAITGGGRNGNK